MFRWLRRPAPRIDDRLRDLETTVEQLNSRMKILVLEWESVYEKFRVAMSKLARRDERQTKDDDAPRSTNDKKLSPEVDRWAVRR